jgi:hypothetical protein
MELTCDNINITDSGIGVEVHFKDLNGDSELYFLIQKHFEEEEDYDEGSYIETHDFDLAGHYHPKIILGKSKCIFEYEKNRFEITYQIDEKKFKELEEFLKILGSVEITN